MCLFNSKNLKTKAAELGVDGRFVNISELYHMVWYSLDFKPEMGQFFMNAVAKKGQVVLHPGVFQFHEFPFDRGMSPNELLGNNLLRGQRLTYDAMESTMEYNGQPLHLQLWFVNHQLTAMCLRTALNTPAAWRNCLERFAGYVGEKPPVPGYIMDAHGNKLFSTPLGQGDEQDWYLLSGRLDLLGALYAYVRNPKANALRTLQPA